MLTRRHLPTKSIQHLSALPQRPGDTTLNHVELQTMVSRLDRGFGSIAGVYFSSFSVIFLIKFCSFDKALNLEIAFDVILPSSKVSPATFALLKYARVYKHEDTKINAVCCAENTEILD